MRNGTRYTFVFSDLHGCLREFDELLHKVGYRHGIDTLIVLGDLVDRGPDSLGVLRRVRELGAVVTLGNHDDALLRFWRHEKKAWEQPGYRNPMADAMGRRALAAQLNREDIDFLSTLPLIVRITPRLLGVHGGFAADRPITAQKKSVIYIRTLDARGAFESLDQAGAESQFWTRRWRGPESVIYGHTVHSLVSPCVETQGMRDDGTTIQTFGIDTGCVFGGRLTCLVYAGDELQGISQVAAHGAYADPHAGIG